MPDDAEWFARWQEGRIGWHEGRTNAYLERHADRLAGRRRVLVPLCGKTEDLAFLASRGHAVVGVELVEDAVRAFFVEHGLTPSVATIGADEPGGRMIAYTAGPITLYAGDLFLAGGDVLGSFDAIYDRGAFVAIPIELRERYVRQLRSLAEPGAVALVVTLEYPQDQWKGPPFAVFEDEFRALYDGARIELLEAGPDTRVRENAPPMTERCFLVTL